MFLKRVPVERTSWLLFIHDRARGAETIVDYEVLCTLLLSLEKASFSSNLVYLRVRSIMSRISQCFRHSGRFSVVFVCGLPSAPRWLWDGSGTHYLGCGDVDVSCLRFDALCSFMRHET